VMLAMPIAITIDMISGDGRLSDPGLI
jgi:hypothetical protein